MSGSLPKPPPLHTPRRVRDLLRRYGLHADKGFGQNFLVDAAVLRAIVDAAELTKADTVLEIGPGLGVLTRELAAGAGRVVSVELDGRLLPVLAETLADSTNTRVVHGDGLAVDLSGFPDGSLLVANLPYNVATPILVRVLESARFSRLVFLVQREVAQRLFAPPGSSAYGALSLIVAHFGVARSVREVKPSAFFPPPAVTSSVVRIDVRSGAEPAPELFRLIHQAFAHRRKTLKKNLLMAGYPAARVTAALEVLGVDPRIRAEVLGIGAFYTLQKTLSRS